MAHPGPPLVGATIAGKYRVERVTGRGAPHRVLDAKELGTGRRVTIELMARPASMKDDAALRFRRDAREAGAIESEHVAPVIDAGHDPPYGLYVVTAHATGEDLATRLARVKKLPPPVAVSITSQIAAALAKAHATGRVHGDLRPESVALTEKSDGSVSVSVSGFGVAKLLGALPSRRPEYASPELLRGKANVDARTDVWSLGAILYEMLAGRRAYPETLPLEKIAPWVPPALAAVVHAAVRDDVDGRIPSVAIFGNLLARATAAGGKGARSDESTDPTEPRPRRTDDTVRNGPVIEEDGTIVMESSSLPAEALPPPRPRMKSVPPRPAPRAPYPPAPATTPTLASSVEATATIDTDSEALRAAIPIVEDLGSGEWTPATGSPAAGGPPSSGRGRGPASSRGAPPPPVDMGGFLVPPPRPRPPIETVPSIERVKRRRRGRVLTWVLVAVGLGLAAGAVLWFLFLRYPR